MFRTLDSATMPAEVQGSIDFVGGLSTFPNLLHALKPSAVGATQVTLALVKKLYNISYVGSSPKASQGVAEFQGQGYLASDLATFDQQYNLPVQMVRTVIGPALVNYTA